MSIDRPQFTHDCEKCDYLGSITFPAVYLDDNDKEYTKQKAADLYCCLAKNQSKGEAENKTIVARFSDEGADYASAPNDIIKKHYFRNDLATATGALIAGYWFAVSKKHINHN